LRGILPSPREFDPRTHGWYQQQRSQIACRSQGRKGWGWEGRVKKKRGEGRAKEWIGEKKQKKDSNKITVHLECSAQRY
jgi:hypothetical protein